MSQAYPLSWPAGWKRAQYRSVAKFQHDRRPLTLERARTRLADELERLRATHIILSTNLALRADGHPKGGQGQPADPGAAVYFKLRGRDTVLACDKWDRVEDNIAALAKHIEAMRGMDRWGVGSIEQAFTGYAALPAPDPWWKLLGLPSERQPNGNPWSGQTIRTAWAGASRSAHPDRPGGSHDKQAAVNDARDKGLELLAEHIGE